MDDVVLFWSFIGGAVSMQKILGGYYNKIVVLPDSVDEYFVPHPPEKDLFHHDEENHVELEYKIERVKFRTLSFVAHDSLGALRWYCVRVAYSFKLATLFYNNIQQVELRYANIS